MRGRCATKRLAGMVGIPLVRRSHRFSVVDDPSLYSGVDRPDVYRHASVKVADWHSNFVRLVVTFGGELRDRAGSNGTELT